MLMRERWERCILETACSIVSDERLMLSRISTHTILPSTCDCRAGEVATWGGGGVWGGGWVGGGSGVGWQWRRVVTELVVPELVVT